MRTWLKILLLLFGGIIILMVLAMLMLPSYARSYIEKHDMEFIGREVNIDDIDINYFNGNISVSAFSIMEKDSSVAFASFDQLVVDLEYAPLFSNTIHLKSTSLNHPVIAIIQNQKSFNFDDLLQLSGDTTDMDTVDQSESWHFVLDGIEIVDGFLNYRSDLLHDQLAFDSLRINSPFLSDTSDVVNVDLAGLLRSGGSFDIIGELNLAKASYKTEVIMEDFDVGAFKPYVDPFMKVNVFDGNLSSDFSVNGNWDDTENINFGGRIGLYDMDIKDIRDEQVLSLSSLDVDLDTIRMNEAIYRVNSIEVDEFFAMYELYDEGSNWDNMILVDSASLAESGKDTEALEVNYSNPFQLIGQYLYDIAKSYQSSSYSIQQVSLVNSSFNFNDFTTSVPFRYELTEIEIASNEISSDAEKFRLDAGSILNKTGKFEGYVNVYTDNPNNIDLNYKISGTDLTVFSPYSSDFVDFPISEGQLLYECETSIRDGMLVSKNVLKCEKFNLGSSYDGDPLYNLPVKLAVVLLRDLDGNINLDIPIEGDLNDPEYKLGKVIWQVFKNIIVKAVTAPFRLLAKAFKADEDELKEVRFSLLRKELNKKNTRTLNELNRILKSKPELNVEFKRVTKKFEEAESYAIAEAKYRYLHDVDSFNIQQLDADGIFELEEFDVKDSLFVKYVDQYISEQDRELPIQSKCLMAIGEQRSVAMTDRIGTARTNAISSYLTEDKELPENRIRFVILPPDSLRTHRSEAIYSVGFWVGETEVVAE